MSAACDSHLKALAWRHGWSLTSIGASVLCIVAHTAAMSWSTTVIVAVARREPQPANASDYASVADECALVLFMSAVVLAFVAANREMAWLRLAVIISLLLAALWSMVMV